MKQFIITLFGILSITAAAFYFISVPHEWAPQAFRFALFTMVLGFMLAMAFYHIFLYAFTAKERAYMIYSAFTLLIVARFFTIPGGIAELIAPANTAAVYHVSEVALILFCVLGMWFSHETLRLKWGGLPTRVIYFITLGLPLVMAIITGRAVGTWWFFLVQVPHLFIIPKGFASRACRANPYALLYICTESALMLSAFVMIAPAMRVLYMPYISFWLLFTLVQAVLLSQSYGEAKRREKELAEEKNLLESLNRARSEFFGNISHEMKTPLTIIATDIQLAEQLIAEDNLSGAKELIREAWHKTMQTADLVTDALAFARGQEISKPMESFDFGTVIDATLSVFEPLVKKKGNTLEKNIESTPPINGNASMLSDALVNLLLNANRHTDGGVIGVAWKEDNGKLCLSVSDNGSGIPPELLPRVFERGVTDGGTGLGLAIVKSVMELHGGEITLESEDGKGTVATLAFNVGVTEVEK